MVRESEWWGGGKYEAQAYCNTAVVSQQRMYRRAWLVVWESLHTGQVGKLGARYGTEVVQCRFASQLVWTELYSQ